MTELNKVSYEKTHDGRRLRILVRGGKGNIVDAEMAAELADVLLERTDGRHLRGITLEAAGDNFSFGASIQEHSEEQIGRLLESLHRVISAMIELDVPVIAAVRGYCLGGGLELVLPAHRIVASPTAKLGQPEVTIGMFAPAGSILLPERVGRGMAEEMLLGGRVLSGTEAKACGLVDELADDPESAALAWFEKNLLSKSAMALRFATRAARATLRPRVHCALHELEALFVHELMQTSDAKEGLASFSEKRPPKWLDA